MAIMPVGLVIEKSKERGEPLHILRLEFSDTLGSVGYRIM